MIIIFPLTLVLLYYIVVVYLTVTVLKYLFIFFLITIAIVIIAEVIQHLLAKHRDRENIKTEYMRRRKK